MKHRILLSAVVALLVSACGGGDREPVAAAPEPTPMPAPAPEPTPTPTQPTPTPLSGLELSLISTTGGKQLPFTTGQALRQGDVPGGQTLVSTDTPELQAVVKNRWPDGSAKFVVLSGRLDLGANTWRNIKLNAGAAPGGDAVTSAQLRSAGVTASVRFAPFGTASWSVNDWAAPFQTLVSGPQMSSWTYRKPIGNDAHLVAWLEVRAYQGGRVEVLPWIENGYLRVPAPASKAGAASFVLGDATRFSQALTLLNHQRAVLADGSSFTHWVGGDPGITPRGNTAYLASTRLVPHYRGSTAANSAQFASLPTSHTPLAQAGYPNRMGDTGYHPSIGLLPQWDAAYLTSGGDPRAFRAVVINACAAGRFGTHYRDETTHRPLAFASYPNLVINGSGGSGVSDTGSSSTDTYTPAPSGDAPPRFANSHHPSLGYLAYLLTGWHYFAEEAQFLGTLVWLKQSDTVRQFSKGVIESAAGANDVRGAAWALRSLAQAATVTPDADALHAQFVSVIDENIQHYHARYVARPNNPLGVVQPGLDYEAGGPLDFAIWMDDFFTAAFGYLKDLQSHSPSRQNQLDAFVAWKYRAVVGRLGSGAASTYNYRHAAKYTLFYAPTAGADFASGAGPWYADWGVVAAAMRVPTADGSTRLEGESGADPAAMTTGYWGNAMPALAYAVEHGAVGAAQAYDRLTQASNFAGHAVGFDNVPEWGVTPRTR